jgi:hypothetical protein
MGVSLCRGPIGEPGGGVQLQGTIEIVKESSRNGTSLSVRAVLGDLGGRELLNCVSRKYGEESSGDGHFCLWGAW